MASAGRGRARAGSCNGSALPCRPAPRRKWGFLDTCAFALDFYAAALDGRGLDAVLGRLAGALDAPLAAADHAHLDAGGPVLEPALVLVGYSPEAIAQYASHWAPQDPMLRAIAGQPQGVINLARLVPAEVMRRTAYWQDFARLLSPTLHGLALRADARDGLSAVLSFWRGPDAQPFGAREEALLGLLQPHLGRALGAASRLGRAVGLAGGLERIAQPMLVLSPARRLVFASEAMRRLARGHPGLALGAAGLRLADPADQLLLDDMVARAMRPALRRLARAPGPAAMPLRGPDGTARLRIEVVPLPAGRQHRLAAWQGVVLLLTELSPPAGTAGWRARFGLTEAEAALAALLAEGLTLAESAKRRGVGLTTVRSQLARLLRKTGCRRQAELTLLLAGG